MNISPGLIPTDSRPNLAEARVRDKALIATAILAMHLALLTEMMPNQTASRPLARQGPGPGLMVFDIASSASQPMPALPRWRWRALAGRAGLIVAQGVASRSAAGTDPFAEVAMFAPVGSAADAASVGRSDLEAVMISFSDGHPHAIGSASFVATLLPDGSIRDVRYLEGSLGSVLGEELARRLEGCKLAKPKDGQDAARSIIGPFAVGDTTLDGGASP